MKKKVLVVALSLVCILALGGCGDNKTNTNNTTDSSTVVENTTNTTEKEDTEKAEQPEDTTENNETNVGSESTLSDEDIESAKKVAMDYYAGTVFEVNSMTYIEPGTDDAAEGECNFMVNVSKDGEVQEPDRMIQLNRKGDTWEIVSEGF
ncbi:TPA: hypothetical protein TT575_002208 [Streptococcus equi subsp. zooepidemicus]|nr:hypothetical protein [Streptococcus equi subsp. zooepidemicus]HEL0021191.1 hypothetical protein [Streptococcus equi subsp. zooepidemicus]